MKNIITIILLCILIQSCTTTKYLPITDDMNKWVGKTEHDVIVDKGAPSSITEDGIGGKVISYKKELASPTNSPAYYGSSLNATTVTTDPNSLFMEFFIGKDGIVYNWRTNVQQVVKIKTPQRTRALISYSVLGIAVITAIIVAK